MSEASERVSAAIESAARDTLSADGAMVTGFVALVTYIDADGARCWAMAAGEEQGLPQSMGMADILEMTVRAQVSESFFGED